MPTPVVSSPTYESVRGTRCVVTGGAGFIGSNLVHALVRSGAHVTVIDGMVERHGANRRNLDGLDISFVECDLANDQCADALDGADIVFNLAGQVSHLASMEDPVADLHLNAVSHAVFLEHVRAVAPNSRVVHASTRQIYGRTDHAPVAETVHAQPVDINGVSKWAGEQLHLVAHRAHNLAVTALRLTNCYGPRQRLTSNEIGFLPVFFRKALTDEQITVFGDGEQRRDLLYVDDVVDVLITALDNAAVGEVFNVGHKEHHSLKQIADVIVDEAGGENKPALIPWPDEHRAIDIGSFHTDSTKIIERLGWSPSVSLRDGVAATVAFYREHPWYLSST